MSLRFIRRAAARAMRVVRYMFEDASPPVVREPERPPAPRITDPMVPTEVLPTRLRLLRAMADGRPVRARDVSRLVGRPMTSSTGGQYLTRLLKDGLVSRDGAEHRITLAGLRTEPVPAGSVGGSPPPRGPTLDLLSLLAEGPVTRSDIVARMPGYRSLDTRLHALREAGFATLDSGMHGITARGRKALAKGLASEARARALKSVAPAEQAEPAPAAKVEPAPPPVTTGPEDVSMVLPSLRHGRSVRLTEIADVAGVSEDAARAEITRLRRLGHVRRAAPDTWQITHGGVSALRSELPERVPAAEEGDAVAAAIEAHVKAHGVTRLPSAGTDELVTANQKRRVYQTDVWSPKSIQSRRKAAVRAGASSRRDEP